MTMLAVQSFLLILAAFLGGAMLACFLRRVFFVRDNEQPSPRGGTRTRVQSERAEHETVEVSTTETKVTVTSEDSSRFGRALTGPGDGSATGAAAVAPVVAAVGGGTEMPAPHDDSNNDPSAAQDVPEASSPPRTESNPEEQPELSAPAPSTPADVENASPPVTTASSAGPATAARVADPAAIAAALAAAHDMMRRTFPGADDATLRHDAKDSAPEQRAGQDEVSTEIIAQPDPSMAPSATDTAEPSSAGLAEAPNTTDPQPEPPQDAPHAGNDITEAASEPATASDVRALHSVRSEALVGADTSSGASAGNVFTHPAVGRAGIDDLKQIRGIGVLIEKKLNAMGIRNYEQIANWTAEDVRRVSDTLDFKGRIERESWIEQARILSSGGTTDFSRRA